MSTVTAHAVRKHLVPVAVRRGAWGANALFWTAFAVLEGVNHGWLAALLAVAFFIAPDLTFLAGMRDAHTVERGQLPARAVPYYNAAHRALVPLALIALYTVAPITWAPIFAGLCGWLAHISFDRALGYGLRTKDGFQRR
ncbi:DUF4260 family protein [Actinomadura montaniterrae]|uniref:DUF4260 domain-containing protein n=1 Tax=Actinomadura montaniterrae TaxID=1803903 RepID=A0A6L3VTU7_9ACTN|nr:DUF4260 family protein [Actinomadura montaniterrae]KAB2379111.1 DUF4260 domain-containing protein [Actinomadura montaniterrae]